MESIQLLSKSGAVSVNQHDANLVRVTDPSQIVKVSIPKGQVAGTQKVGSNLEIVKTNGEKVTVENFFTSNSAHEHPKLVIEDENGQLYLAKYDAEAFNGMGFTQVGGMEDVVAGGSDSSLSDINPLVWAVPLIVAAGAGIGIAVHNNNSGGGHHDNEGVNNSGANNNGAINDGKNDSHGDNGAALTNQIAEKYSADVAASKNLDDLLAKYDAAVKALDIANPTTVEAVNALAVQVQTAKDQLVTSHGDLVKLVEQAQTSGVSVDKAVTAELAEGEALIAKAEPALADGADKTTLIDKITTLQTELADQSGKLGLDQVKALAQAAEADPVSGDGKNLADATTALTAANAADQAYQQGVSDLNSLLDEAAAKGINGAAESKAALQGEATAIADQMTAIETIVANAQHNKDSADELNSVLSQIKALDISGKEGLSTEYAKLLAQKEDYLSGKLPVTEYNQNLISQLDSQLKAYNGNASAYNDVMNHYVELVNQAHSIVDNGFTDSFNKGLLDTADIPTLGETNTPVNIFDTGLAVETSGTHTLEQISQIVKDNVELLFENTLNDGWQAVKQFLADLNPLEIIKNFIPEFIDGVTHPIGLVIDEVTSFIGNMKDALFETIPALNAGLIEGVKALVDVPGAVIECFKAFFAEPSSLLNPAELGKTFFGYITQAGSEFLKDMAQATKSYLSDHNSDAPSNMMALVKTAGMEFVQSIGEQFKHAFEGFFEGQNHTAVDKFFVDMEAAVGNVLGSFEHFNNAFTALVDQIHVAVEHFSPTLQANVIDNMMDKVGDVAESIIGKLGSATGDIADLINGAYKYTVSEKPLADIASDTHVAALVSKSAAEINLDSLVPASENKVADSATASHVATAETAVNHIDTASVNDDQYALSLAV